jgi:ATP-binding cassette subfamily C protein CydD
VTTTTDAAPARLWLTQSAAAGARRFRLAATFQVVATASVIAQWIALAGVAQTLADARRDSAAVFVIGFALAGVLGVAAVRAARRATDEGADAIAAALRARVLRQVLPKSPPAPTFGAAQGAHALLDLSEQVAEYHARVAPIRRSAVVSMVLIGATVAIANWPVALILLIATALMPINMRLAGLAAEDASRRQLSALQQLGAKVLDSFRGIATIRALRAVDRQRQAIQSASESLNRATTVVLKKAFLSGLVMDAVVTFAIAVCATYVGFALLGYVRIPGAPPPSLFSGLLVLLLCPLYFLPLRQIASGYHERDRAVACADELRTFEAADTTPEEEEQAGRAQRPVRGAVAVELRRASFRHADAEDDAISAPSASARAGEWTVVTGASGSGKTTLLSILAGFRPPTGGVVEWVTDDGATPPYVGSVSWIGQRTIIVDGSLEENIRLGTPAATTEDVRSAAAAAGLGDLIARLPEGVMAHVGDGGWGVSAGEARRVAIARAILRDSQLWILDEPTAHLDPDTEEGVLAALRIATCGRTVIIATHSPAVVRNADAHWHLEDTTIVTVDLGVPVVGGWTR